MKKMLVLVTAALLTAFNANASLSITPSYSYMDWTQDVGLSVAGDTTLQNLDRQYNMYLSIFGVDATYDTDKYRYSFGYQTSFGDVENDENSLVEPFEVNSSNGDVDYNHLYAKFAYKAASYSSFHADVFYRSAELKYEYEGLAYDETFTELGTLLYHRGTVTHGRATMSFDLGGVISRFEFENDYYNTLNERFDVKGDSVKVGLFLALGLDLKFSENVFANMKYRLSYDENVNDGDISTNSIRDFTIDDLSSKEHQISIGLGYKF